MVSGLQDLREQYFKCRSIHEIEIPIGCRANLKIASFNTQFPENSVIIWVIQRKHTRKGPGPPIPQPPNIDPDIPECSKGYRIPLLGNPLPRILMTRPDCVNHYPRLDALHPNKIIQSPELQKAKEERSRNEAREAEILKLVEESMRAAVAREKKEVSTSSLRTSSRVQKLGIRMFTPPTTSPSPQKVGGSASVQQVEESKDDDSGLSSELESEEDGLETDSSALRDIYKGISQAASSSPIERPSSDDEPRGLVEVLEEINTSFETPTGISPKRTRAQAKFENAALHSENTASTAPKRSQTKTTTTPNSQAAAAPPHTHRPGGSIAAAQLYGPSPPVPRGTKPKSRIAQLCVNCNWKSTIEWRNRPGPERNICQSCFKRRDKVE